MKNIFYIVVQKLKTSLCLLLFAIFIFGTAPAQTAMKEQKNVRANWNTKPFHSPCFIENKGQFNGKNLLPESKITYGVDVDGYQIYFTPAGLTYRFDVVEEHPESKTNRKEEKDNYSFPKGRSYWTPSEKPAEESKMKGGVVHPYIVTMQWLNSNPGAEIIVKDVVSEFFTYADTENPGKTIGPAHGYKKLIYKNLYQGIDAEYVFHPSGEGIKYSLILHPGADFTKIKMLYSGAESMSKDEDGNIHFITKGGSITEHAPKTFYLTGNLPIASSFNLNGNTVSFDLQNYDTSQNVVIDPWVTPIGPQMTTNGKGFDLGRDAAGNVYVYGGYLNYKLAKYTSAGVAIWTYATPFGATSYQGDLAVHPPTGDCFITEGCCNNVGINRQRINSTTGTSMWSPDPGGSYETWNIAINPCNSNQIITGGYELSGNGSNNGLLGAFNLATGAYNLPLGNPPVPTTEIRSLTINPNGNIYGLTVPLSGGTGNFVIATTPAFGLLYSIASTYTTMIEFGTLYTNGFTGIGGGQNGIVSDNCFLYTTNGGTLHKRAIATGAILDTFLIPNGAPENCSGVEVDNCGNVYVGSMSGVYKVDPTLALITFSPTGGAVYCITLNTGGEILACGNGFVTSIDMSACAPVSCTAGVLTLSVSTTPASCGSSNGSAAVTSTGGTPPFTYSWSNGQTSSSATGLSQGTYTVTVTATGGCLVSSTTATILNSNGPVAALTHTDISCNGQCTGAITANVSGGGTPYTFLWSNGQSTSAISNLCPGTYSVTVTNANGCTDIQSLTISEPIPQNASVSGTNPACNGGTGSATVTVTGGTPPNTFLWENGQNTQTVTGLPAGNYSVTITDANGCINTLTVAITQPAAMTVTVTTTSTTCNNSTGTASANVTSGGTSPFTYVWSNGQTGQNINNLGAGNHIVIVTDANGCTQTQSGSVTNSNGPVTTMSQINVLCNGQCTGGATATVNNGALPYTYAWSSGQLTSAVNNFCAGNYTLLVTDATGCTDMQTVNITEPDVIAIGASSTPAGCGISNGTAAAAVTGGTSPYTYAWNTTPVQNTLSATGLAGGTQTVLVTDANGCTQTATVAVTQPPNTLSVNTSSTPPSCGASNGTATAATSGGTSPYTYSWITSPAQNTSTANGLLGGTYSVTVTDSAGCVSTQSVLVNPAPTPTVQASGSASIIIGDSTQLSASGTAGVSYNWTPVTGLSDPTIYNPFASPVATTEYCVTATDANGCSDSACVRVLVDIVCGSVFVPNAFSPNGDSENDLECVIGNCITTMTFRIYNRWGEKVFETSDRKVCWDGKWRGSLQNAGVYTYYLTGATLQGEKIDRKGNITLMR